MTVLNDRTRLTGLLITLINIKRRILKEFSSFSVLIYGKRFVVISGK